MLSPLVRAIPCFALLAAVLVACSGGSASPDSGDAQVDAGLTCQADPRAMTFQSAMSIASSAGRFHIAISSAQPAPPARDTNVWTVALTDASGAAVTGATIAVKPWMPDHGHGASVQPVVAANAKAGSYDVTRILLVMPGLWQVIFTITAADGSTDTATFAFCVPS